MSGIILRYSARSVYIAGSIFNISRNVIKAILRFLGFCKIVMIGLNSHSGRLEPKQMKRISLGIIVIAVVMIFVALATDFFWVAKIIGRPFPKTMPVSQAVYDAFAIPDLLMSFFLYIGAIGLMRLRKFGLVYSLVAMGMWIFDSLLVLGITKLSRIDVVGFSLAFAIFTVGYLLHYKDIFD